MQLLVVRSLHRLTCNGWMLCMDFLNLEYRSFYVDPFRHFRQEFWFPQSEVPQLQTPSSLLSDCRLPRAWPNLYLKNPLTHPKACFLLKLSIDKNANNNNKKATQPCIREATYEQIKTGVREWPSSKTGQYCSLMPGPSTTKCKMSATAIFEHTTSDMLYSHWRNTGTSFKRSEEYIRKLCRIASRNLYSIAALHPPLSPA